ncbi:hypothetical protein K7W03_24355 [Sphingobium sp. PNB]|uniref:hypothetical protein n=1 Tax=Sphingobium sp. PNB TaxID=863934 RepID=UPI001CA3CA5B|nr:hypothetical protein [Sphingobium sp. PNB]MCB4862723.1 hypothetical protein [Sphingobium sp. PNB]
MTTAIDPPVPDAELFDRLRGLIQACGTEANKHDQAIAVIAACIDEGLNTRPRIVGAMRHLGFSAAHAAMMLNEATGCDPSRYRWQRDSTGRYSLLN